MGLTSLARINRSGVYDFWENFWETKYLYKYFLFNTHTIQNIYSEILSLFFFKYIFKNSPSGLGYTGLYFIDIKYKLPIYFSKVWVLRYQNWFIIISYYLNINLYLNKRGKLGTNNLKQKNFLKNFKNYNYNF